MELPTIEQLEGRMSLLVRAMPGRVQTGPLVTGKPGKLPFQMSDEELVTAAGEAGNVLRSQIPADQKLVAVMLATLVQVEATRRLLDLEALWNQLKRRQLLDEGVDSAEAAANAAG